MTSPNAATDDDAFQILWKRFRIVAATIVVAVLAGAMTFAHSFDFGTEINNTAYRPSVVAPERLPHDHLTGIGATMARFRATSGPSIGTGTFGPAIQDAATGDVIPTYDVRSSTSQDFVDTLVHSFPAMTSQAKVLAAVRAHDIPADAHLVHTSAPDRTCKVLTFRSAAIADSGPYEDFGDGTVTVTLSSRIGSAYSPTDVRQAYESIGPDGSAGC